MLDVTALVLEDHAALRRGFALLDDAHTEEAKTAVWDGLSRLLEVHAACEEAVFYPALLQEGENADEETDDALEDHNAIRDAIREAARHAVGSPEWEEAVGKAREENSDHLAEEEREALPDLRANVTDQQRADLAVQWLSWRNAHERAVDVSADDVDKDAYLEENAPS